MKKLVVLLVISCLAALSASAVDFSDMPNDWSAEALTAAVENGLLSGSDGGKLLPQNNLTRAEMATVMVRAFGGKEKADISAFTDVPSDEWYYDSMATAVKMGLFNGDGKLLKPEAPILREEAFAVIARALSLGDGNTAVLEGFKDGASVSDWAKGAVSALVEAKYINGSEGLIEPQSNITRAEFAQVMHNIFKKYLKAPGNYSDSIQGSVIISSDGITLKNCTVEGDIIVADGVVMGVALDNVDVKGRIIFRGGNANTMANIVSNNILMPVTGTVVNHDLYGSMIGGEGFNVMNYIKKANPEGFIYENGAVISPDGAIMSYGDIEISFGMFRYYYRAFLSQFDGGDSSVWNQVKAQMPEEYMDMNNQIKLSVSQVVTEQHIAMIITAQENGIDMKKLRQAAAQSVQELEMQYAQYGVNLSELMAEQGITIQLLTEMEAASLAANALLEELYYDADGKTKLDNSVIQQYITDNGYMRAQHILVEDEQTANEVLAKLDEGEDFMTLVEQYNTDPGMTEAGEAGYFFRNGEMVTEFETACKELETDGISAPVKTDYGYHIIRRLEPTEQNIESIAYTIAATEISEKISQRAQEIAPEIVYNEIYEKIEPANLH